MTFKEIPIDRIIVNKNIRTDPDGELGGLMETIEKYDMLQPILVIPKDGSYELVSGHRRLEAMKARNEATIPCIVRSDISDKSIPFIRLIENVQRKQLSTHELIQIFEEMKEHSPNLTQHEIGRMIGKTGGWVNLKYSIEKIYVELLESGLPEEAIDELKDSDLMKLRHRVKSKKERKKIAIAVAEGGEIGPLVEKAESYIEPQKHKSYASMRDMGFKMLLSGDHNLLIVCRNPAIKNEIENLLINRIIEKFHEREQKHADILKVWEGFSETAKKLTLALSAAGLLQLPPWKKRWARRSELFNLVAKEIDTVMKEMGGERGATD